MTNAARRKQAHRYGIAAERIAAFYLRCKGYRIVAERYRNALGEIDLVAVRGKLLVAVEVKARRTLSECEESVTPLKRRRIARAMEGLLASGMAGLAAATEHDIRFDAIWIAPWTWPRHIQDAWRM